jgi:hypothetical protein
VKSRARVSLSLQIEGECCRGVTIGAW